MPPPASSDQTSRNNHTLAQRATQSHLIPNECRGMECARQRHVLPVRHSLFRTPLLPKRLRAHRVYVPLPPPQFLQALQVAICPGPLLGGGWCSARRGGGWSEVSDAHVLPHPRADNGALESFAGEGEGGEGASCTTGKKKVLR
jgi:hypothetical protein